MALIPELNKPNVIHVCLIESTKFSLIAHQQLAEKTVDRLGLCTEVLPIFCPLYKRNNTTKCYIQKYDISDQAFGFRFKRTPEKFEQSHH